MNRNKTIRTAFLIGFFAILSIPAFAGDVTLSTYYPAPFGAYDRMKLVPRESLPLDPYCDENNDLGSLYYDNGKGEKAAGLYVCQETSADMFAWVLISGLLPEKREQEKDKDAEPVISFEKVVCVGTDGKLGVCVNNPSGDGTCACQLGASEKK